MKQKTASVSWKAGLAMTGPKKNRLEPMLAGDGCKSSSQRPIRTAFFQQEREKSHEARYNLPTLDSRLFKAAIQ